MLASVDMDRSNRGSAGPWQTLAHRLANSGSTAWTIPQVAGDSVLVRVTAFDHAGGTGTDVGNALTPSTALDIWLPLLTE